VGIRDLDRGVAGVERGMEGQADAAVAGRKDRMIGGSAGQSWVVVYWPNVERLGMSNSKKS
jgi:hypothetical protein